MTEEMKRHLIDMFKSNLIIKIISNTHFETELIQLLIANDKYHSLDVVPFPELISNLENLILVAQKAEMIEVNSAAKNAPRPPSPPRPTSRNPSGSQEACDICLLYEFDSRWCRQQGHCRVSGHQPTTDRSQTRERQIRHGDLSCFVLHVGCPKCNNPRVMNVATPPFLSWPTPPYSQLPPPPPRPPSPKRQSWNLPPPRPDNRR